MRFLAAKTAARNGSAISQFLQLRKQLCILGKNAGIVFFYPAEDPFFVHDENRSLCPSDFFVEDAELAGDRPVRPKVGQERERNPAEGSAPGAIRKDRVATDSQNLAICPIELSALRFIGWDLFLSGSGKRKRVERDDDVLAPAILAQFDIHSCDFGLCNHCGKGKIRRHITDFEFDCVSHESSQ